MSKDSSADVKVAKQIIILGPNCDEIFRGRELKKFVDEHDDVILIGDGKKSSVTEEEIRERVEGRIDSFTRIDICGHGSDWFIGVGHDISMKTDKITCTADVLKALVCTDQPMQVHLWSCYGGSAAQYVEVLPAGSVLLAHAAPDTPAVIINTKIKTIVDDFVESSEDLVDYQNVYGAIIKQYKAQTDDPLQSLNWVEEIGNEVSVAVRLLDKKPDEKSILKNVVDKHWPQAQSLEQAGQELPRVAILKLTTQWKLFLFKTPDLLAYCGRVSDSLDRMIKASGELWPSRLKLPPSYTSEKETYDKLCAAKRAYLWRHLDPFVFGSMYVNSLKFLANKQVKILRKIMNLMPTRSKPDRLKQRASENGLWR